MEDSYLLYILIDFSWFVFQQISAKISIDSSSSFFKKK